MKILVLQLARLGDIYQTWPVLKALKRLHPEGEIHLLTRAKFSIAAPNSRVVDHHWSLNTRATLAPLIEEKPDLDAALDLLVDLTEQLKGEGFDRIINLSFSPFSSYLMREISSFTTEVVGYTRFSDGYLCIPDDGSAYFYAQVGPGKSNRLHVTDLMAYVAGVELQESDWQLPEDEYNWAPTGNLASVMDRCVLVHLGASDLTKTLGWSKWVQVVRQMVKVYTGQIVLIGSGDEVAIAEKVIGTIADQDPSRLLNLVGKTELKELFTLVKHAELVIGGDSGPMQMASLTGTPALNISFPSVSFWETAPRSRDSRIIPIAKEDDITSDQIVQEAISILAGGEVVVAPVCVDGSSPFQSRRPQPREFEWELVRAIYMGDAFPAPPHEIFIEGIKRLSDVNHLAMEQIEAIRNNNGNKTAASILDRVDEIMDQIVRMVPELKPLVTWFHTERIRIGPIPVAQLIETTYQMHQKLDQILSLYLSSTGSEMGEGERGHDDICLE